MRWRIAVSATIGLASGAFCWFLMKHFHQDAADFRWALHLADRMLARQNPYDTPLEQYPLTAGLFALPFLRLAPELTPRSLASRRYEVVETWRASPARAGQRSCLLDRIVNED